MPVLQGSMETAPEWCELEHYAISVLAAREQLPWYARHPANKLIVVTGSCTVGSSRGTPVGAGESIDSSAEAHVVRAEEPTTLVTLGGHWGDDYGGAGVFTVTEAGADQLGDPGDAADYPKETTFDRHFHDCDEYWIVVSGRGTAVSENVRYEVGPGDCIATRAGDHHDFPLVDDPVVAVFFETTMRGRKRRGHLWEHTHGPVPAGGR